MSIINDKSLSISIGKPTPFGSSVLQSGVNFSIFSQHATSCVLVLFKKGELIPFEEIQFPEEFKLGSVFTMFVHDLDYENIEYCYKLDGPFDPSKGLWFDKNRALLDPYAKSISGRSIWKQKDYDDVYEYRSLIYNKEFNWEEDVLLKIPMEDLIIYEMSIRDFTSHHSSGVKNPGTYDAVNEKIDYLKKLGINCIEIMPIFEYDELENSRISPITHQLLSNCWGYSPISFFAPKMSLGANKDNHINELKNLIKNLHKNGIEVIFDVVYNHTAEGNEHGKIMSLKGIDNNIYYMLTPEGYYYNFSGCGNTLNCNDPIVINLILESLRYWVSEFHVDGFRFDLASILGRNNIGYPMCNPPLIEAMACDPVLSNCKLIAEAWDAGGLYQVGSFPSVKRWSEWNGKFRDDARKFLKGDEGLTGVIAQRVQGSPDLYWWKDLGINSSINFITCHDGFSLRDLWSYTNKRNYINGESNTDGCNDNNSWNCDVEGETENITVIKMRKKLVKNSLVLLMMSRGTPMIYSGDEMYHTKQGNNNCYCQDNEISWLDWDKLEQYGDIFNFFKKLIDFRKQHPIIRKNNSFNVKVYEDNSYPEISWHGVKAWQPDFSYNSRTLAFLYHDKEKEDYIYTILNSHWETHNFELPILPNELKWHMFVNTDDYISANEVGDEKVLQDQNNILVAPRSSIILIAK